MKPKYVKVRALIIWGKGQLAQVSSENLPKCHFDNKNLEKTHEITTISIQRIQQCEKDKHYLAGYREMLNGVDEG